MLAEQRRNEILNILKDESISNLDYLSSKLKVSRVTIQRDIILLEKKGLVDRFHGGVQLSSSDPLKIESKFDKRLKQNYDKKLEIARKAIEFVKDNTSIFIDASTTGFVFATELFKRSFLDLNIITTSPAILCESLNYPDAKIIITGGVLNQNLKWLYGDLTSEFLQKVYIDSSFISPNGVSIDYGITSTSMEITSNKGVAMERSKEVNLLVDSTKFNKVGMCKIKPVSICKRIITDKNISKDVLDEFNKVKGLEIIY